MKNGYKHLIECHCVLPQYRKSDNPVFHQFPVFSEIDDAGVVVPKVVQCNNCGAVHRVVDMCVSEIALGKDEAKNVLTKRDVSFSLPKDVVSLLEEYQLDVADYEAAKFFIENELWGRSIVLSRENDKDGTSGKILTFVSRDRFKVEPFFDRRFVE